MSLCRFCRHVQAVKSGKGSVFFLCTIAKSDPKFSKYPPQPVIACSGHVPIEPSESARKA